ncbi:hypothetical protein KP17_05675 [Pectobacterium parvum]|uniref:glycosyltransferase n=1 Tax=Pectobacterium parvum TaxID=2778550 RepID=UPI00050413FE|nr:glycosyltransferase [Pectobacterium parvum]KFX17196.1 hypothetical protein KP17_05675 [Pectobacterium parvum]
MKIKISVVIVAYNPTPLVIDNINAYVDRVDVIYFIDNSSSSNIHLLESISKKNKIIYLHDGVNKGISISINLAANKAYEEGVEWLLTMDQDSQFVNFDDFINYIEGDEEIEKVGIYSPFHDTGFRKRITSEKVSYIDTVMTSGNIVNINALKRVGGLDERFFIDRVDHDFCATLVENGYLIKRLNYCTLKHNLGNINRSVKGKEITNHSPFRRYYITRNFFYYIEKHLRKRPIFCLKYVKEFFFDLASVAFFEKNKISKLKYICLGFFHYLLRKKGIMILK